MSPTEHRKSVTRALIVSLGMLCAIAVLAGCAGTSPTKLTARPVQQGRPTPASSSDDLSKPSPAQFNPCKLVSLSEAQAITGGAITSRVEAPLGPTCIYSGATSKSEITVAIESLNLSQVSRQLGQPQPLSVGTRHGYCGRLGAQMLFVPLAQGRVLHITASCAVAQQFAVRALSRVTA